MNIFIEKLVPALKYLTTISAHKMQLFLILTLISAISNTVYASPMGHVETIGTDEDASGIAVSKDGTNVYLATGLDNSLLSFSRNPITGELTEIDRKSQDTGTNGLGNVSAITISPDDKHVYTIGLGDTGDGNIIEATVLVFTRNTDGSLTQSSKIQNTDFIPRLSSGSFTKFSFSPDGNFLHVINTNGNELIIFKRSSVTGELTFVQAVAGDTSDTSVTDFLSFPRGITMSPDGNNIYVTGSANDPVTGGDLVVLTRDKTTGLVTGLETHLDLENNIVDMNSPEDVVVSPDGKYVYVVAQGSNIDSNASVVVFARATDGSLTYQSSEHYIDNSGGSATDILFFPTRISISPNGRFLYVGSIIVETVSIFKRNLSNGTIQPSGFEQNGLRNLELGEVTGMSMSNDGKFLYVATQSAQRGITVFDLTIDLLLDKVASNSTTSTGQNLSYTLTLTNNGASDATGVTVTDTLPAELTFLNASTSASDGNCTLDNSTVTCTLSRVSTNAGETLTIDVSTPATETTIINQATASADQIEVNVLDNTDSASTIVETGTPPGTTPAPTASSNSGSLGLLSILFFALPGLVRYKTARKRRLL